jgi:F420-0:gamma-glutamyl ligase-like protein
MPAKKKTSPQAAPFLTSAAEAIGTALGKLAVKTGVATPTAASKKRKKVAVATKKKVTSSGKSAKKSAR